MSEKLKPSHDLAAFRAWANTSEFRMTGTALGSAASLGFGEADIVRIIRAMQKRHFHKSMTSHSNHREWQNVYHVPSGEGLL